MKFNFDEIFLSCNLRVDRFHILSLREIHFNEGVLACNLRVNMFYLLSADEEREFVITRALIFHGIKISVSQFFQLGQFHHLSANIKHEKKNH